jgi:hypothetical protein
MLHKSKAIKNGTYPFPFLVGQVRGIGSPHRSEFVL